MMQRQKLPLSRIEHPESDDVICRKGREFHEHVGNERFRRMIRTNTEKYRGAETKYDKTRISLSILRAIRNCDGRFLRFHSESGTFYDIGDEQARHKISQALREAVNPPSNRKRKSHDNSKFKLDVAGNRRDSTTSSSGILSDSTEPKQPSIKEETTDGKTGTVAFDEAAMNDLLKIQRSICKRLMEKHRCRLQP